MPATLLRDLLLGHLLGHGGGSHPPPGTGGGVPVERVRLLLPGLPGRALGGRHALVGDEAGLLHGRHANAQRQGWRGAHSNGLARTHGGGRHLHQLHPPRPGLHGREVGRVVTGVVGHLVMEGVAGKGAGRVAVHGRSGGHTSGGLLEA